MDEILQIMSGYSSNLVQQAFGSLRPQDWATLSSSPILILPPIPNCFYTVLSFAVDTSVGFNLNQPFDFGLGQQINNIFIGENTLIKFSWRNTGLLNATIMQSGSYGNSIGQGSAETNFVWPNTNLDWGVYLGARVDPAQEANGKTPYIITYIVNSFTV